MYPPLSSCNCGVQRIQCEIAFTSYSNEFHNFSIIVHWLCCPLNHHIRTWNIFWVGFRFGSWYVFIWSLRWPRCLFSWFASNRNKITVLRITWSHNSGRVGRGASSGDTIDFYIVHFHSMKLVSLSPQRRNSSNLQCIPLWPVCSFHI